MKILAFLLLFLTTLSGQLSSAQGLDSETRQKILSANNEAIKVMQAYASDSSNNPEYRETARLMAELLDQAAIVPAVGIVLEKSCGKKNIDVIADTSWLDLTVSICPYGFTLTKNELIQTFIHEAYHLYEGQYYIPQYYPDIYIKLKVNPEMDLDKSILKESETRATSIELKIMSKIYKCIFFVSSHISDLRLKENKDYFVCK